MGMIKTVLLFLTCVDAKEARKIGRVLLEKRLIVCAKRLPISSTYRWKGKIREDSEVLLLMETVEEKFAAIEREVRKLHSYETFVLLVMPVSNTSKGVGEWMREELGK